METTNLHFLASSSNLTSILADQGSLSETFYHPKFSSRKAYPHHGNLVSGECPVLVKHGYLSISLELSRSGCSILRGSFDILTSFWRMKLDMWLPSAMVEVLIKCYCCKIPGTFCWSSFSNWWKFGIHTL